MKPRHTFGGMQRSGGRTRRAPRGKKKLGFEFLEPRHLLSAVIGGKIAYELPASRYDRGIVRAIPVSDAFVFVTRNVTPGSGQTAVVDSGYTDANGDYALDLPNGNYANMSLTVYVVATASPEPGSAHAPYAVYSALAGVGPVSFKSAPIDATSLGTVSDAGVKILSSDATDLMIKVTPNVVTAELVEEFDIFEALHYGYSYYMTLVSGGDTNGVTVYYNPSVVDGGLGVDAGSDSGNTFYQPDGQYIQIARRQGDSADEYWQVVLHEYGHYIADINGFLGASPSPSHAVDYNLRDQGALTDGERQEQWNEGFADFFSTRSAVVEDTVLIDFSADSLRWTATTTFVDTDDLSIPAVGQAGVAVGEDAEGSIANILYQLAADPTGGLVGGDSGLFDLIKSHGDLTLGQFFGSPPLHNIATINAWAALFDANGVTPTQLRSEITFNGPEFQFEIPQTVTADGDSGGAAFDDFRIMFFNAGGHLIGESAQGNGTADWYTVGSDQGVFIVSMDFWRQIVAAAGGPGSTIEWTVQGAWGPISAQPNYGPFFPALQTFQIPPEAFGMSTVPIIPIPYNPVIPYYPYFGWGNPLTVALPGVTPPPGSQITSVSYYLDTSGTGLWNPDTAQLLGTANSSDGSDGGSGGDGYGGSLGDSGGAPWSLTLDTSNWQGNQTIFAIATDDAGDNSVPMSVTVGPLAIASVSPATTSYTPEQSLSLSANGLTDWSNQISSVSFYQLDADGSSTYAGTSYGGSNGWSATLDTSSWSGPQTLYAVATNSLGYTSDPTYLTVSPNTAPTIAAFTASSDRYVAGLSLILTANGVTTADGNLPTMAFYRDTSGTGVFNINTVQSLGSGFFAGDGWDLALDTSSFIGPQTFFAVATDDQGAANAPVSITVAPHALISIGSFTVAPGAVGLSTLTASDLFDWGSTPVAGVNFYVDTSGTGIFNSATATLLGTATAADGNENWNRNVNPTRLYRPQRWQVSLLIAC